MRIFGAHVFPWLVEKEAPTRYPAVSAPVVSFQPTKTVPVLFTTIVGSTCQLYGDEPSVTLMFGKKGTTEDGVGPATSEGAMDRRDAPDARVCGTAARTNATTINVSRSGRALNPLPRAVRIGRSLLNRFALPR